MKSLIKILTKKKLKISFVESCTGGLLASSITSINGASKVFGLGKIKIIPGTFGSFATIIILYVLFHTLNISNNIILIGLIIIFF